MPELNDEAKTIIARAYVKNPSSSLDTIPVWIDHTDALDYLHLLQNDQNVFPHREIDRVLIQDGKSRSCF